MGSKITLGRILTWVAAPILAFCAAPLGATVNLAITGTDTPDPAVVRSPVTYTIRVVNNGNTTATSVKMRDTLPSNVTVNSIVSSGTCTTDGNDRVCDLGNLGSSRSSTVILQVVPRESGTLTNVATASSDQADTDNSNNTTTMTTSVDDRPEGGELTAEFEDVETVCKGEKGNRCRFKGAMRVFNEGLENATTFTMGVVLSRDELLDNEDILLKVRRKPLNGGWSYVVRWNEKLRPKQTVEGRFLIGFIDVRNEVEEEDEENNLVVEGPIE